MLEASTTANVEPVLEMEGKEVVLGENATKILNNILEQAYIPFLAKALYNAGYRKATDVAREIFEEIQRRFKELYEEGKISPFQCCVKAINETEKKYTESEDTE